MKKVIVIVVVFLIMIGGMIGEITYVNKFYNGLQADLEAIAQSIDENEEHVQNPQTEQLCDAMLKKWERASARC